MKKKLHRRLHSILFLLIAAFCSMAVLGLGEVVVNPDSASPGDTIDITVIPDSKIYQYVYLYHGTSYVGYISLDCASYICTEEKTVSYTLPSHLVDGTYTVKAYDYSAFQYVEDELTITGGAGLVQQAELVVDPENVTAGDDIAITLTPGSFGTSSYLMIYKDGTYVDYIPLQCGQYICYQQASVIYSTPAGFTAGEYEVRIYDYGTPGFLSAYFTVENPGFVERFTTFTIDPIDATPDDEVFVVVTPGSGGAYPTAYLSDASGQFVDSFTFNNCNDQRCYLVDVFSFNISDRWVDGTYNVRVYDYQQFQWIEESFTLTGSLAVEASTTVQLSESIVEQGETVSYVITPGSSGAHQVAYLYKEGVYESFISLGCGGKCYDEITGDIDTSSLAIADYTFKVYDYLTTQYIDANFTVIPSGHCTDTDPDQNASFAGNISYDLGDGIERGWSDYCIGDEVHQIYCPNDNDPGNYSPSFHSKTECTYGCEDGRCRHWTEGYCIDTEPEQDVSVYGYVKYHQGDGGPTSIQTDSCWADGIHLRQHYCPSDNAPGNYSPITVITACEFGCENGVCVAGPAGFCTDNDPDQNVSVTGTVSFDSGDGTVWNTTDYCFGSNVYQFYCLSVDDPGNFSPSQPQITDCEFGCENGACLERDPAGFCVDNDPQQNIRNAGEVRFERGDGFIYTWQDDCSGDQLFQAYCPQDNDPGNFTPANDHRVICYNGCENGACITGGPFPNCYDTDRDQDPTTAGEVRQSFSNGTTLTYADECENFPSGTSFLTQYGCYGGTTVQIFREQCSNTCSNGACQLI